ncbi:C-type lectin domain family 4 member G-like [Bufo gargarizans]|uniref:C-type lectin domain family 4 member G-like n=1 Tax=Bufo gargarizans TaxID=30331 RepID=UPI001CF40988|nr:C-type lectin domain family 4 member G-like [Bufo gargarizans]
MQNVYGISGKGACGITDDENDADDYENVIDNRKVPTVPERLKKGNKTTCKREDLQLKNLDKPANSIDTPHGPRTIPLFRPPHIGLDFASSAVNAAFRDQTVEQTSEKKLTWNWKKIILICYLIVMFLFLILLTSVIFIYYSNISIQLAELKKNASHVHDSVKKEIETVKDNLMKVNQTLVSQDSTKKAIETVKNDLMNVNQTLLSQLAVLKSDVQSIKKFLGLCTSCPVGWTLLGSSCYFFSSSHQTWPNSQKECSKMDSSLLILNSKMELDVIRPFIGSKRFWIGLRRENGYTWRWVDGMIPVYTNWYAGEPNNSAQREHCTEMISGGWNDLDCSKTIDYICRKVTTCRA